jgi:hypothetical protein
VRKTHRLVECDEDIARCGIGAEIAYQVQELAFEELAAPVRRVAPTHPSPSSPVLNAAVMPSARSIAAAVRQVCGIAAEGKDDNDAEQVFVRRAQPYPFGPLLEAIGGGHE